MSRHKDKRSPAERKQVCRCGHRRSEHRFNASQCLHEWHKRDVGGEDYEECCSCERFQVYVRLPSEGGNNDSPHRPATK